MKNKIKRVVIPIFLSLICGFICGRVMFSIYEDKGSNILDSDLIYLLFDSYADYDDMKASTMIGNYMYYEDDGKYNAVVAMTKDKNNIDKIEKVYDKKLKVSEYLVNNDKINSVIEEYDTLISDSNNDEEIRGLILEMTGIYKDNDDIKMVKIS